MVNHLGFLKLTKIFPAHKIARKVVCKLLCQIACIAVLAVVIFSPLSPLFATQETTQNLHSNTKKDNLKEHTKSKSLPKSIDTQELQSQLSSIEDSLAKNDSIWLKRYADYANYMRISREIDSLGQELAYLLRTNQDQDSINQKKHTIETLQRQLELLKDKSDPFADLIKIPEIPQNPTITNPFAIISGISFVKSLNASKSQLDSSKKSLDALITLITNLSLIHI